MPSVDDIYSGILKPGPDGGIYAPGAEVRFPGSDVVRVTPEGLNVRSTQTVAVDPFTGNPIVASSRGTSPVQAVVPGPSHTTAVKSDSRLPQGLTDEMGYGAPVHVGDAPGVQAIEHATTVTMPYNSGPISPWAPSWSRGINPDLRWEDAQRSGPVQGDAWQTDRFGDEPLVSPRGYAIGPAPTVRSVIASRQPVPVQSAVAQALAAQPGAAFLQARGVDTSGMTIGQQANELNKQLAGSSRNADGSRGFM